MYRSLLLLSVLCLFAVFTQTATEIDRPWSDNKDGCSREFLFFEFTTKASITEIKEVFKDVKVIYCFKVIGAGRYFVVVKNDQSQALKDLRLPNDACTTTSVFPVEKMETFFGRFGIYFPVFGFDKLTNDNLIFVEVVWDAAGLNEAQYQAMLAVQADLISQGTSVDDGQIEFVAVAKLQTTYLFFGNRDDCFVADSVANSTDAFGGPGSVTLRSLRLMNC